VAVWIDALPNLVIGLREGLEIGLVVTILLTALRKAAPGSSRSPIWYGVLAAALLSLGFGAVLAFSQSELTLFAQAVFGGLLSLVAVALVTWMIFWMRRTARSLSGELRGQVSDALTAGAGALALTAFLAVAREGLETALFIWTTVQASGETVGPIVGAAVGIGVAVLLCWLLARSAVKIDLGKFFSRTAILLVVIAAGVLSYGIGELQTAGLIPGHTWLAFDISSTVSTDSAWVSIVSGITNLQPSMTWLQVATYVGYLVVVLFALLRKPSTAAAPQEKAPSKPARTARSLPRWAYGATAVVLPLVLVGAFAMLTQTSEASTGASVTVSKDGCAKDWQGANAGRSTISVTNSSNHGGEIYLIRTSDSGVIGEIEGLGPGTKRSITVDLKPGQYSWRCLVPGELDQLSPAGTVRGSGGAQPPAVAAVTPVSEKDLEPALASYNKYVAAQLSTLDTQTATLRSKIASGDLAGARAAWLPAQQTWDRIGASYGSFGDFGTAIDGLPQGLPNTVADKDFTGLYRLEYGLWHGQQASELTPIATTLHAKVVALQGQLSKVSAEPADLPLRAHEILEDSQRRHLAGVTDFGAHAAYPMTLADVDATNAVLDRLEGVLNKRRPDLVPEARKELAQLRAALVATHGQAPSATPLAARQQVDARIGGVLETLSAIPTLLEVRAN
jgi:high-affinity iron transporter